MREPRLDRAVSKYLAGLADEERAPSMRREYDHCVVVPAFAEGPLTPLLDSLSVAAAQSSLPSLLVLVANEPPGCESSLHDSTKATLDWALAQGDVQPCGPHRLVIRDALDVLLVERTSATEPIPAKHGVGGARAIGMNIALDLVAGEVVGDPYLYSTDADVLAPEDYFSRARDPSSAALVYPFEHAPLTDAMIAYELGLRYYVAGLAHAGSQYAFHTIGSCMAIHATALAQVRGVPRRPAGEDFYLLNKVRKVADVQPLHGAPLQLSSRPSNRTPFGTGRAVERLENEPASTYDPRCFDAVKATREELLSHGDGSSFGPGLRDACAPLFDARDQAAKSTTSEHAFARRVDAHFDGFRTLKLIHHLTDRLFPKRPLDEALSESRFVSCAGGRGDVLGALRGAQNLA